MKYNMIENASKDIAATGRRNRLFNRFTDSTAERSARPRELLQNLATGLRRIGGRWNDIRSICTHNLFAIRLLLAGNFDHINGKIQSVKSARHRKRRAPLPGTCFGRDRLQPLLLCIISLCNRRIEFMRAGCIVAFKFIINMSRRSESLFQHVGAHQRRRTIHLIEAADILRNIDVHIRIIQLLFYALFTKHCV